MMAVPEVRDAWGVESDETPEEFATLVYGAKFRFQSGGSGYVGDLFILQGDALTGAAPMVLRRDEDGNLIVI
jgi:hypothetical protein